MSLSNYDHLIEHAAIETDDCTLWPFGLFDSGYGVVQIDGRARRVHMIACERHHGPRPEGMQVRHSCRNRHCFNPRHLQWGTGKQNSADKLRDGTDNRGESNSMARLDEYAVRWLRSLYSTGNYTQAELGRTFGLNPRSVTLIVRRKTWRHI